MTNKDKEIKEFFEKNSPGTQNKKLNLLTDYKEDYPNQQTNKLDTLTDYQGNGNAIQYQQINKPKTNYNSNKKRSFWKRFKEDIKNNWVGYTIAGIRDGLIGSIGYYLRNGFYVNGTDTYTPPTQNATPIVSHISQYWNTTPIGWGLMAYAIIDLGHQLLKIYSVNKYYKNLRTDTEDIKTNVTNIGKSVDTINTNVTNIGKSVDTINTNVTNIGKSVTDLGTQITNVENKIEEREEDHKYFRDHIHNFISIFSRHMSEKEREELNEEKKKYEIEVGENDL